MKKEMEVKILNIDVLKVIEKLNFLGAKFLHEENQKNYHIFSSKIDIIPKGSYLRIRELLSKNGEVLHCELTYKENIANKSFRENNEFNANFSDTKTMLEILKFLGYDIVKIGEKNRISFEFMDSIIDIDTWNKEIYPYPYMEIETESFENLYKILNLLEIDKENISLKSIEQLREEVKNQKEYI
ncbi:MAG: class IV adenylate cyclase [Peptoniphilaceae bacterium]|uniref:class IV adenylate cyclase n=1 Tax=Parvimonas sp. TaxID=1944660 RepID=UPI002A74F672|nr:class IV adenylate cyclase [Parvimonas sp.]MDD7765234.1 class IV adenylate cyclase [Peptoniphilaceae bacterium]MDY3051316.1 class IV adenylate cyclase [Parvimonas sp.]